MRTSMTFTFLVLSQIFPAMSHAGDDYKCVIDKRMAESDGSDAVRQMNESYYLGKEFTIERATGLMAGALKNSYVTKPTVVDYGAEKVNSYKV